MHQLDKAIQLLGDNPMMDRCRHTLNDLQRAIEKREAELYIMQTAVDELKALPPLVYVAFDKQDEKLLGEVKGLQTSAMSGQKDRVSKLTAERHAVLAKWQLDQ